MKKILIVLLVFFSVSAFAESTITLQPGQSVQVESTTVVCSNGDNTNPGLVVTSCICEGSSFPYRLIVVSVQTANGTTTRTQIGGNYAYMYACEEAMKNFEICGIQPD